MSREPLSVSYHRQTDSFPNNFFRQQQQQQHQQYK